MKRNDKRSASSRLARWSWVTAFLAGTDEVQSHDAAGSLAERYAKLQEESDALHLAFEAQAVTRRNCALMPGRFADGTVDPAKRHPEAFKQVSQLLSP